MWSKQHPPTGGPKLDDVRRAHSCALWQARAHGLADADAEDVASTAVVRAVTAWSRFVDDGMGSLERWLATIVRNVIRDRARRINLRDAAEPSVARAQIADFANARPPRPDERLENLEARACRDALIDSLSISMQVEYRLVALVSAGELSRLDAASTLGVSVHSYDKVAQGIKHALRHEVVTRNIEVTSLFDVDREG